MSANPQRDTDSSITLAAVPAAVVTPAAPTPKAAPPKPAPTAVAAASDPPDAPAGKSDPLAATAQPVIAGKQDPANGPVTPPDADASAPSASSPTAAAPHAHAAETANAHATADPTDAKLPSADVLQPPMPAPAASGAPAAALTATAASAVAIPLSGLALEIAASAKNGKSSFEIRLDPAELGRIDVRIDVDRSGRMTSHLMVEKPETLSMLQQDAPQLQRALDNAGFKTGDGGLQFSLRDQSSPGGNGGNGAVPNAQRLIITEDDAIPAAIAGRTYGRMPGSGSGVDIMV